MPVYKFTRIYKVEAASKAEAIEKVKQNPTEYLEYEGSTVVQTEKNGFIPTFKKQIAGR